MKIGVLGTGVVGSAIGRKLVELGHEVRMGSREAGNEKAHAWAESAGANASEGSFADAAAFGELVVNCTAGQHSLGALEQAGRDSLAGKVLVDVANTLDFSGGMPPTLGVCNTDSLGERIQRAFPDSRVVKTLNTMNCDGDGRPGTGAGRARRVRVRRGRRMPRSGSSSFSGSFGWPAGRIVDLGGIRAARGTEMYLPLWLSLYGALGTGDFNIAVEHAETEH